MERVIVMRINLDGIKPEIWREISVESSISFDELHETIQKAMGWEDYHAYEFQVGDKIVSDEDDEYNMAEVGLHQLRESPEFIEMIENQAPGRVPSKLDVDKVNKILRNARRKRSYNQLDSSTGIDKLIKTTGQQFTYIYDLGDHWHHLITVENISDAEEGKKYPTCSGGARACPPEDCGGPHGYHDLMEIRKNKKHPDYNGMVRDWLGEDYDPERFDLEQTNDFLQQKDLPPGSMDDGSEIEDEFIPLSELTQPDNDKIQEKSLYHHEEEYADYLGAIEFAIADYFLEHRTLKDADVTSAINNIKEHPGERLESVTSEIEKEILLELSLTLQEESLTRHELALVLNHILWAIDNRSWMKDPCAYVSWLPYIFKMYGHKELHDYKTRFTNKARQMGAPDKAIEGMLGPADFEMSGMDDSIAEGDSILFSIPEDKRFSYVEENGLEDPGLLVSYISMLESKKQYGMIEKVCLRMLERSDNFPTIEYMMGMNYLKMGDNKSAMTHIKNAVENIDRLPKESIPPNEYEAITKEMRRELKRLEKKTR